MDLVNQPYDLLLSTIRTKDGQMKKLQDSIDRLEKQLKFVFLRNSKTKNSTFFVSFRRESEEERQTLAKTNHQLTKDVEKLLEYQEVRLIKEEK